MPISLCPHCRPLRYFFLSLSLLYIDWLYVGAHVRTEKREQEKGRRRRRRKKKLHINIKKNVHELHEERLCMCVCVCALVRVRMLVIVLDAEHKKRSASTKKRFDEHTPAEKKEEFVKMYICLYISSVTMLVFCLLEIH